jgi:hypothetical protein
MTPIQGWMMVEALGRRGRLEGLRTKKIWKRIEMVERLMGLDFDRDSQDQILCRLLEELSPEDLLL